MNSDDMVTVGEEKRKQRAGKLAQKMGWDLAVVQENAYSNTIDEVDAARQRLYSLERQKRFWGITIGGKRDESKSR